MALIEIDDKKIYYEEYGANNNKTIVYFHGGPGESCLTYTHQAKVLGEKFHVISFDQYGVLRSDAIPENTPFGVKDHAELIEQMRIALGIKTWTPLGHSYGGMLACCYAFLYPNSVDNVIYDCPMWSTLSTARTIASAFLPYYKEHNDENKIRICNDILNDNISAENAFQKAISLEVDEGLKKFCHVIDEKEYEDYIVKYIPQVDIPEEYWYKYLHFTKMLFEKGDFYDNYLLQLSEIEKPQLLMVGEYDITCGKDQIEWFCNRSKNGKYVLLENSAHLSWMQVPDKYLTTITDFMEG